MVLRYFTPVLGKPSCGRERPREGLPQAKRFGLSRKKRDTAQLFMKDCCFEADRVQNLAVTLAVLPVDRSLSAPVRKTEADKTDWRHFLR